MLFSQEILEHVLQYADGETLLTCRDVSPEFKAAVNYLDKTKNIWEECYSKEKGEKIPYGVIYKLHPHNEGLKHPKNWGVIYETCFLGNFVAGKEPPYLGEIKIGKEYSDIQDLETHDDLVLVLVKYKKNFTVYYRILTINLQNNLIHKSSRFCANMLYLTPIEDASNIREDVIMLSCNFCHLVAVPVCEGIVGFPRFSRNDNFLTVEHSNGELLWIKNFGKLLTKGSCFHTGREAKHEEIKEKAKQSIKVLQGSILYISCGKIQRKFNTFRDFQASVTAYFCYSDLLFLGTDTGMLYVYRLSNDSELEALDLQDYIQQFNVCSNPILVINATELKNLFVIVCSSEKSLYHININREFKNFS